MTELLKRSVLRVRDRGRGLQVEMGRTHSEAQYVAAAATTGWMLKRSLSGARHHLRGWWSCADFRPPRFDKSICAIQVQADEQRMIESGMDIEGGRGHERRSTEHAGGAPHTSSVSARFSACAWGAESLMVGR